MVTADIEDALRILRPVLRRQRRRSTATCRSRWRPSLARDTDGTDAAAKGLWERDRRAQPLREDPRHRRGRSTPSGARIADGPQHQRHAAVRPRALRRGDRGVPAGPRGARRRRRRPVARVVGGVVLRVAGSTPLVDRRLDEIGTDEALALKGKAAIANAQLAYQLFLERFSGRPLGAAGGRRAPGCSARCGRRPRPRTRPTPTRSTSTRSSAPTPSTRCPTPPSRPSTTTARSPAPSTPTPTPTAASSSALAALGIDLEEVAATLEDEGVAVVRQELRRAARHAGGQGRRPLTRQLRVRADARRAGRRRRRARRVRRARHRGVPRPPQRRLLPRPVRAARRPGAATSGSPTTPATRSTGGRSTSTGATSAACPLDDEASNYRLGREALLERVGRRQRQLPDALRGGARPLPAAARRARPPRRRAPRPRRRRPHRVAVPRLARPRRRPRPARRDERGPVRRATRTRA